MAYGSTSPLTISYSDSSNHNQNSHSSGQVRLDPKRFHLFIYFFPTYGLAAGCFEALHSGNIVKTVGTSGTDKILYNLLDFVCAPSQSNTESNVTRKINAYHY